MNDSTITDTIAFLYNCYMYMSLPHIPSLHTPKFHRVICYRNETIEGDVHCDNPLACTAFVSPCLVGSVQRRDGALIQIRKLGSLDGEIIFHLRTSVHCQLAQRNLWSCILVVCCEGEYRRLANHLFTISMTTVSIWSLAPSQVATGANVGDVAIPV